MAQPQAAPPPLSVSTKFWFGFGQAAEGIKNASFNLFLFFYYSQVLGLNELLAGTATMIGLVFDAVTDPLVGSISDSWKSRWGRRHPFMYASALPMAISFYFVWAPVDGLGQIGLFTWMLVWSVVCRAAMTLYHVPHLALGADLSEDYRERTLITAWRQVFQFIGILALIGVVYLALYPAVQTADVPGQRNPAAYPLMGWMFGIVIFVTIFGSALGTHTRIPHLVEQRGVHHPFSIARLVGELRQALSNASFRALFMSLLVFFVTRGVEQALSLYMGTYFWRLEEQALLLSLATVVGVLVGFPFWVVITARIDKKPAFMLGIGIFGALTTLLPTFKLLGLYPDQALQPGLYVGLLLAAQFVAGFGVAGPLVAAGSMLADIADEHEMHTGQRQEGVFFGANSFSAKASTGIGGLLAALMLWLIAFPQQAAVADVPPLTVTQLGILYGPAMMGLVGLSLAILGRYTLTRQRHMEIQRSLRERQDARKASDASSVGTALGPAPATRA